MKKFIPLFLLVLVSATIKGQVTVNGGPTLTYTSLNTAFAAINAGTHFGAITIDITGNTTEGVVGYVPTPLLASGQSAANYSSILIRPTVQATVSGAPAAGRGVIELDGADNVTIDGDLSSGPVQRDLTLQHSGAANTASTAVIRLLGKATGGLGATNVTIQNNIIVGNTEGNDGVSGSTVTTSFGVYAGGTVTALTATGLGDNYDNLIIRNNEFNKSYYGFYLRGTTANPADNCLITGNTFGSNTVGRTLTLAGIDLSSAVTSTVSLNDIFNLTSTTTINPYAIQVAGAGSSSVTISRNKIHEIRSLNVSSGYGAYGINITGGTDHLIINNVIYDITGANYLSTSQTFNAFGIRLTSGTGHRIYYNSVNLFGIINLSTASATSIGSAAFLVSSTGVTGIEVKNNIFCNTQTSTLSTVTTKKFMAVWFPTSYNFANAVLNNNSYNVTNDGDHFVGKVGTTNNVNEAANLAAWKAFSQVNNASNDVNSIPLANAAAPFVSNTNLTIPANTNTEIESGAVLIPSIGTNIDHNGNVRPLAGSNPNLNPDMGAYEFDGIAGFATDAGISALVGPAANGCYTSSENVIVTISNFGTSSISNIPVTVTVSGVINQTLTGTYAGPIAPSATFNYTIGTINMSAAGVYSFNSATSLPGDQQAINDAMSPATRTVIAPTAMPQSVPFTGFTGANLPTFFPGWYESAGASPTGTTSSWTSQTGLNSAGNVNARVLLSATAADEWIIGPKVSATSTTKLSFDVALTGNTAAPFTPDSMGVDDMVRVMISTNCGVSFTPIFTISATNSLTTAFTNYSLSLAAYAGQDIIIGFLATDGPVDDVESYYFHLDNINLYNGIPTDAGVSALVSPSLGCLAATETVVVTVTNYGTASISNFPVTVWVSGAATQTLTSTFTGIIPPSASSNFTLGTLNMAAAGTYSFKAFPSLAGDIVTFNDTTITTRTKLPLATLPQFVDFTGFTGANLPTVFPDWYESDQMPLPTNTVSSWTSQSNLNSTGNVNARVLLSTTTNQEWIVGPKVLATANTNISFDAAITGNTSSPFTPDAMGSDDMVRVMISTNCGNSFTPIFTISATNSLTTAFSNFNLSLASYNGQEIVVAFLATDGPTDDAESYYFHLDNINLYDAFPIDAGVSAIVSPSTGCFGSAEPVVVTVNNFGTTPATNFSVSVRVSGAVTQTLTSTYTAVIPPQTNANFTLGTLNMTTAGTYTLKGFTSLSGDQNTNNDTSLVFKTSIALSTLPQSVNFTGFTGSNLPTAFPGWREGVGAVPNGTTSSWTSQANLNGNPNTNARVLLSGTAASEWIVSAKVVPTANTHISFDAAITGVTTAPFTPDSMGSDDMVRVMVSTDCGVSFTPIYTISETNSLTTNFSNFNLSLAAYAGQETIIGFWATDGPVNDVESYYFHLENINLYNLAAADGGVSAVISPTAGECLSTSQTIAVTVNNYGLNSITNFPVTAYINGPVNTTITANYTGVLSPSTSASFTIGTANMNPSGTYTIYSFTGVSGDPNAFNDAVSATFTQTPDFNISGGPIVCSSGSQTLNITGSAATYTWFNSSNSSSVVVTPSVTTTYSAVGTGTNNCQVTAFFTVSVVNPTITGIGAAVCGTTAVGTLTANAFAPVSWYATPSSTTVLGTGNTFTATAATTTTYYAEAVSTSAGSMQTTFAGGTSCGGGNMFDITPISGSILLDSLDVNTTVSASNTLSVIIYYKIGTYVGSETTAANWIAWDTIVATSAGSGNPTRVVWNNGPISLPNNQLHALYIHYASAYTAASNLYNNGDITVQTGAGLCSQFGGVNAGRTFNGNLYYSKPGCISPKIPVTLTVNPLPVASINASPSNTICAGNTVTLTASGADTYTWSTSATSTVINVTPSVSTAYTLDAGSSTCPGSYTAFVNITVNPLPNVTLNPANSTVCINSAPVALNGSPAGGVYSGPGVSGSSLSTSASGTFNPVYSYTNSSTGCSNSATTTVIVSLCTDIISQSVKNSSLKVYPNPNSGVFTIETGNSTDKTLTMTDVTGRIVYRETTAGETIHVNVSELANGVYHLRINSEHGIDIIKVVKQ